MSENHHIAIYIKGKCVWFYGSQQEIDLKDVKVKKFKGINTPPLEIDEIERE